MGVEIVAVTPTHAARWRELYQGYADFYRRPSDDAHKDVVWGWLMDPNHELEGYLALVDGIPQGLAHVRRMPSPLRGQDIGFLDDLFVDPAARGHRVGEHLLAFLADLAGQRGWGVIRWITADDNYRARALYDRVAAKTAWNLYEMPAKS
ncbi:MAG: GNAT family N-acetyltransferase [Geminicoccaceae bacterium]|nr:MAG: GNAT family N-acetyltransferase [Geminicoccaceae bacterium]